jgi:hypothetical protein
LFIKENTMYTTSSEGLSNIYANEPPTYFALYPSPEQQQRYALQGGLATLFVTALVFVAFAVS